ncbi:MAG: CDP-diacylglycerol--glycerol-3-phosphate 3-phosphatidyltransferase [Planctomycetes bacterium]|nr:CDP-diacylglycerol--glycerol-3-phosphate 3-phosphatidyltransferase [Planctomycetota bacterium]
MVNSMATATQPKRQPPVFNLPNQLTAARLGLAFVLFVLIEFHLWVSCGIVFTIAAFTDWLDGYLARKQGLTSTLGRNMDPLVDKVLVCGAYIFLLPTDAARVNAGLAAWMVTVVVSRELIITGLRGFMETSGITFGADWLGKIKMVLQCVTLLAIFAFLAEWETLSAYAPVRDVLIYATLFITALSGLQYIWRACSILRLDEALR